MPAKSPSELDKQLDEILTNYAIRLGAIDWLDDLERVRPALQRHYLALALEIVGDDERNFSRMGDKSTIQQLAAVERNKLRGELRAGFRKALG